MESDTSWLCVLKFRVIELISIAFTSDDAWVCVHGGDNE